MSLLVEPVSEVDTPIAVRLLLSRALFPGIAARRFHEYLTTGEFDVRGLFVAKQDATVCGAMFAYLLGGAQAAVWLPVADDDDVREALVAGTMRWLRESGTKVVQAVLSRTELPRAAVLERAGFRHIAQLQFLSREVSHSATSNSGPLSPVSGERVRVRGSLQVQGLHSRAESSPPLTPALSPEAGEREKIGVIQPLTFHLIAEPTPEFVELLLRTYIGSLDLPELDGLRTGEEILAGYATATNQPPPRWWRIDDATGAVAVLMLSALDDANAIELTYLGVVPEARGRGYGRLILDFALDTAVLSNGQVVNLSVDVRNEPALRLYRAANFREFDLREVFLCTIPYTSAK